jgi:hypothetical protein
MKILKGFISLLVLGLALSACQYTNKQSQATATVTVAAIKNQPSPLPSATVTETTTPTPLPPTATPSATPTTTPTATPWVVGPDSYPSGINPLTGLPADNPDDLALPPALVSIPNVPLSARPQSGLSFSPLVFELFIGEGATRFLGVFYGGYPTLKPGDNLQVGPIRSGRRPYESLRQLYRGFMVMASASWRVYPYLNQYSVVYGVEGADSVSSAFMDVNTLRKNAQLHKKDLGNPNPIGLKFDTQAPAGGKAGKMIWIPYHTLLQVFWRFDQQSGKYLRWEDNIDGKTFPPQTDKLTGKQIAADNVIVLYANDRRIEDVYFDMDFLYIYKQPALIFRDGKMYEGYWTTKSGDYEIKTGLMRPIRFMDAQGNPFPLKPGHTWIEIVPLFTPYYETVDSQVYKELDTQKTPGSGNWAIRFYEWIYPK